MHRRGLLIRWDVSTLVAELFKAFGNGIFYSRDEVHLTMMLQKSVQLCIRICVWCKSIL